MSVLAQVHTYQAVLTPAVASVCVSVRVYLCVCVRACGRRDGLYVSGLAEDGKSLRFENGARHRSAYCFALR